MGEERDMEGLGYMKIWGRGYKRGGRETMIEGEKDNIRTRNYIFIGDLS